MAARRILAALVLTALLAVLAACGQKGDLYQPDSAQQVERKG